MRIDARRRRWLALGLLPALAACAVGPDFESPAAPDTARYTAEPLPEHTVATAVAGGEAQRFLSELPLPEQWWTLFRSAQIDHRVTTALANSPDAEAARAALRQAQENYRAQRGGLFPAVDAGVGASRQKAAALNFGQPVADDNIYNLYNASVDVSYTFDLFGGVRRGIEAQAALVDVQRYELQATYLTLAGNVVTGSIGEASLRAQIEATEAIVAAQESLLTVTEQQYELGAVGYAELLSARSNLASTRATLPPLQSQLAAARHQLAVYLGQLPGDYADAAFKLDALVLPAELPLTLPAELVRRRPDVRAAEALLHRAAADIGVATANLLPRLSLSGSFGSQSTRSGEWFDGEVWNIGANLVQPIFRGGELRARRRAAVAAYDEALAAYRGAVLNAYRDVADSLRALHADAETLQAQHLALTSAAESLALIEQQYALGSASYLALLVAQRQHQQAQLGYLQALAGRYQDTAALLQALGGGWFDAPLAAAQTTESNPPRSTP